MKILDLCSFPLDSLSLIEASAGTGKTYAVANLYLRYLLEKDLSVDEILVVTFTEAATQELRDRIRARIQELSVVFCGEESSDEVLNYLYRNSTDIEADKLRLRIAERQIDQSEIHTIHGFCQQLLSRYALDLNVPFNQQLAEDTKPILLRVCEDFWRKQILHLPKELILEVYSYWASPADLLEALLPLISRRPEVCAPAIRAGGLDTWKSHYDTVIDWHMTLRKKTLESADEVQSILADSGLKSLNHKINWFNKIRAWCESETLSFEFPAASKKSNLFEVFTPTMLGEETKKNCTPPAHQYFDFLEAHLPNLPANSRDVLLVQCYQEINEQFKYEKDMQNVAGFDDLILSVSQALRNDAGSELLTSAVRERFSVALIDEFQDTDREQYHIFSSLFASEVAGKNDASMVLIGDPKQAIYAFRGGDIATYLKAKEDVARDTRGHLFTMDTNWRSSPQMVEAVNQVFMMSDNAFMAEAIPFYSVNAARSTPETLLRSPALNIGLLPCEKRNKEVLTSILADHAVNQIKVLLNKGNIKFSDIAVLVRSETEAELIKSRLSLHGLSASYEGKSNIYESVEAKAIYSLLSAIAEPNNEYLIRHCLSDLFFCVDDERLEEINTDDLVLEEYLEMFNELLVCWNRFGVLAAIRKALNVLGIFSEWNDSRMGSTNKAEYDWERSLSNINQIAELLQAQSERVRGHFALLRFLRRNITNSALADDQSRLRLESDEQLIRIVTIHKSKGLEYPYVFLPFMSSTRGADLAWFYDSRGRLNLDLSRQDSNVALVDRERLAEDIRLLYVALTRAKYQCYLGTFFYKGHGKTSLGVSETAWAYLIAREAVLEGMNEERYQEALEVLAKLSNGNIELTILDEEQINSSLAMQTSGGMKDIPETEANYSGAMLERSLSDSWRVQSFTGLMQEVHSSSHTKRISVVKEKPRENEVDEQRLLNIFDFPRGSKAGTFLHTLFENVEFESGQPLKKINAQGELIGLRQYILDELKLTVLVEEDKQEAWAEYLQHWLINILNVPLQKDFSLSSLSLRDYQSEMEFFFRVEQCQVKIFNDILKKHCGSPAIDFESFKGHLKGAIDLVFLWENQYYLLDYKSNYLGDQLEDYLQDELHSAMLDHRYDLQYLIYSVALHRYLKLRIGSNYSYDKHFGGVYYLYLRGMPIERDVSQKEQTGVYFTKPQAELIYALDHHMGVDL